MDKASSPPLEQIRALSDQLVKLQSPIRILNAVKWPTGVRGEFFRHRGERNPAVTVETYRELPLGFDPAALTAELMSLERDITRRIGELSPVGQLMKRMCREFRSIIRMLELRGTPGFHDVAVDLYGSPHDVFHAGEPSLAELGVMLEQTLNQLPDSRLLPEEVRDIPAEAAVEELQRRVDQSMAGIGVKVTLADDIVSDASAGGDQIKINRESLFSERDLDVLEAHEGWIHVGTTQNGLNQPWLTFLAKGTPASTVTQEGLAVLTEIVTLRSTPRRLQRLVNRIRAVTLATDGASFVDVFRYLRNNGVDDDEAYTTAYRAFRGSLPDGRPFTKDLAYIKGFVLTYNLLRMAVQLGQVDRLALLMTGKVHLDDLPALAELRQQGVLAPPRFLPPHLKDLRGLAVWMSFGKFVASLSFERLEHDYRHLFA